MSELHVRAVCAGVCFGIWPLLMNRSGLGSNVSPAVLSGVTFLVVIPLVFQGADTSSRLRDIVWTFGVLAGIASALGVVAFNGGLAKSTPENVSTFFVLMVVVQVSIPAIYQVLLTGTVTPSKMIGFVAAIVAAYFLS